MVPQPIAERRDRTRIRLDGLLGSGFALLIFGARASDALAEIEAGRLGLPVSAALAVLPSIFNPDFKRPDEVETLREIEDSLGSFFSREDTVALLFVRTATSPSQRASMPAYATAFEPLASPTLDRRGTTAEE